MKDKPGNFLEQHEMKVNKIVLKIYYGLVSMPVLIAILSYKGIYHYDKTLSIVGIVVSVSLAVFLFLFQKFSKAHRAMKYVLNFALQFIIFLYSIDVNIQMSVTYALVPLLTLAYFNPKFELLSSILATISITVGTCLSAKSATTELYRNVTPLMYCMTTGGGRLVEFIFADIIFYKVASIARSIMQNLKEKNDKLNTIQDELLVSFAEMIESRDYTTGEHVKRTSKVVKMIVDYIKNHHIVFNEPISEIIPKVAPLHDIGKMKVPDSILTKPGKLTDEEFEIIKTHTTEGDELIDKTISKLEDEEYVRIAKEMAHYHHEKWDGNGYPENKKGCEIPISARIMAIADVFDALCSKRSYKEPYTIDEVFDIIVKSKGTHFEPVLVDIMLNLRKELETIY